MAEQNTRRLGMQRRRRQLNYTRGDAGLFNATAPSVIPEMQRGTGLRRSIAQSQRPRIVTATQEGLERSRAAAARDIARLQMQARGQQFREDMAIAGFNQRQEQLNYGRGRDMVRDFQFQQNRRDRLDEAKRRFDLQRERFDVADERTARLDELALEQQQYERKQAELARQDRIEANEAKNEASLREFMADQQDNQRARRLKGITGVSLNYIQNELNTPLSEIYSEGGEGKDLTNNAKNFLDAVESNIENDMPREQAIQKAWESTFAAKGKTGQGSAGKSRAPLTDVSQLTDEDINAYVQSSIKNFPGSYLDNPKQASQQISNIKQLMDKEKLSDRNKLDLYNSIAGELSFKDRQDLARYNNAHMFHRSTIKKAFSKMFEDIRDYDDHIPGLYYIPGKIDQKDINRRQKLVVDHIRGELSKKGKNLTSQQVLQDFQRTAMDIVKLENFPEMLDDAQQRLITSGKIEDEDKALEAIYNRAIK